MKHAAFLLGAALLAGCQSAPIALPVDRMTSAQLCEAFFFPPSEPAGAAAAEEATRRDVRCAEYRDAAILMQQEREAGRWEAALEGLRRQPRAVTCRSVRVGITVQTVCD